MKKRLFTLLDVLSLTALLTAALLAPMPAHAAPGAPVDGDRFLTAWLGSWFDGVVEIVGGFAGGFAGGMDTVETVFAAGSQDPVCTDDPDTGGDDCSGPSTQRGVVGDPDG